MLKKGTIHWLHSLERGINIPLMLRSKTKIYWLFLSVMLIWGLSWPMNKIGIQYLSPIWFTTCRLIIATISSFVVVKFLGKLVFPSKRDLPLILSIGLLQMGIFTILINIGLQFVDAGRSAILSYTTPLWVLPIAILWFNEKATFLKWMGFGLGMSGVLVLFSPWTIDWSDRQTILGNLTLLAAAFCMAISILAARNLRWHRSPLELLPWQFLVGALPTLALAFYIDPHPVAEWNAPLIMTLVYTGLIGTAIGNFAAMIVGKELPSITVSLGFLGVPIFGVLFSSLILHEAITLSIQLALLLIPSGIACLSVKRPLAKTS
ncbi:MAG: DMT family transporter [Gammaproteobacteria bacterium]